jgi:hypothetical protein
MKPLHQEVNNKIYLKKKQSFSKWYLYIQSIQEEEEKISNILFDRKIL